jgi:CheY-like chemotaxis protein
MRSVAGGFDGSQVSTRLVKGLGTLLPIPPATLRINRLPTMKQNSQVLVVDDRADIRYTIAAILRHKGFEVILATDGASALQKAHDNNVGLFLLDVQLPDINGFELCRRIKRDLALAHIPVVMCSGNCAEEDLQNAADAGAIAYISKPFDVAKLADCISRVWTQSAAATFANTLAQEYSFASNSPAVRTGKS